MKPAAEGTSAGRSARPDGEGAVEMSGELVMERFRLLERIGAGGMGVVYRAFDERLQRDVAVKAIAADDPERILREAQAAARLNHPGIVTVYELGRRNGHALLVSELVPGTTLGGVLEMNALSDRDVAEIGADLCDALAHAHAQGVVHRDLKPENVMVRDEDGAGRRAKLMDFGIARVAGAPTLTASGEVVGTLAYMSPEQAEGAVAEPPSDVYSLALTLYECWAGANPVRDRSLVATARRIGGHVESLALWRPDLPERLVAAIDGCLEADPGGRPGPAELGASLEDAIPALDPHRPVPPPERSADPEPGARPSPGTLRIGVLVTLAASLALLAGPGGLPGAALVLTALLAPALVLLPTALALAAIGGAPLGALGIAGTQPGGPGCLAGPPAGRALAGALGSCWALAAALGLGAGSRLGVAPRAPSGWETSAADAASFVLEPLLDPIALLAAAVFAAAAATLGWILAARHLAIAALGAVIWAASLSGALSLIGDGALGERPVFFALAGGVALAIEHARRRPSGALTGSRPHRPGPGAIEATASPRVAGG
jgi:eukaryotic-like serine/threonine-protein kinase